MKALALCNAVIATLIACSTAPRNSATALPNLSTSLDEVRAEFNMHKQEARFLTLLAPT